MYLTVKTYISDGVQTQYPVPMSYIKREYIKAYTQSPTPAGFFTEEPEAVGYEWLNSGAIRLDAAPPSGTRVIIRRETYADKPLVDFQDAAILLESDLDLASLQALHVAQEAKDDNGRNLVAAMEYFRELENRLEGVVAEGLEVQERLEKFVADAKELVDRTQDLLDRADELIEMAQDAKDASGKSSLEAREAEYWARLWASQSPGVEVKDGLYSARHYADTAKATGGDIADHVDAYDPHPQYLRKDQAGDGLFEADENGDIQMRRDIENPRGTLFHVDAWGDIALF